MSLRAVMAKSRSIAKQVAELASIPATTYKFVMPDSCPGHDEGESVTELSTYGSYPFTGIHISKPPFPVSGSNVAS